MNTTTSSIVMLILVVLLHCARADTSWGRADEQVKYGQRKLAIKSGDAQSTSEADNLLETEENLTSEEVKSSNYPVETTRTNVRQKMDNLVRDMRSKTLSKMFSSADLQEPIEQMPSYGEQSSHQPDNDEGNIQIAVKSKRKYEFVPFHYDREEMKTPRTIEIVSDTMPLRLHFKSQSAAIVVTQSHMSPPMKPMEEKVTMDEPYRLSHEIHRPILQTVKEFIHPYRNIVQTLRPVREDIRTIVPKDSDVDHSHMDGGTGNTGKTNDWSPVANVKRPPNAVSARLSVRPSPGQQLQQQNNRYNPSRTLGQIMEGVKTSESRPRLQRRTHNPMFDTNTRPRQHEDNDRAMQFGSSEQDNVYTPHYSTHDHRTHMDEQHYMQRDTNLYNLHPHESFVVPGTIGDTISRRNRHNMVQCSETGCEVSPATANAHEDDGNGDGDSLAWIDDSYDRHYF